MVCFRYISAGTLHKGGGGGDDDDDDKKIMQQKYSKQKKTANADYVISLRRP
jgi:hypothetical protein